MRGPIANLLFFEERRGAFVDGHIFFSKPDLESAQAEPGVGYWHCDIAHHDRLTWTDKVYEFFDATPGTPIDRDWAVMRYGERSRETLKRVRTYALSRKLGFILDAAIGPEGKRDRWIRILAIPIVRNRRVVGLHGVKREI